MSNGTRRLAIEPLTKQAFAEFGDVIEVENSDYFMINNGSTRRYHKLAETDVQQENGQAIISIFQATPLNYPLTIRMLERHPLVLKRLFRCSVNPILLLLRLKVITQALNHAALF
ncbi:ureidoglycolate hydrolase [Vibrio ponticus]|nr:ureidoglycolate hydrolase [Vibrio ponticus]